MQISTTGKNVLFQFVEETTGTRFINSSKSGILISSLDQTQSGAPRWGKVVCVGEKVDELKEGDYILLEAGKWTSGFYVDKQRYWKTDIDQILATADEPTQTY